MHIIDKHRIYWIWVALIAVCVYFNYRVNIVEKEIGAMAQQKYRMKMKKHEDGETAEFERREKKADRRHFAHEGAENIPDHRRQHFTVGKHAIDHREDAELYSPKF